MNRVLKAISVAGLIVGFFSIAALAGLLFEQPARAMPGTALQDEPADITDEQPRTITVSGQGQVSAQPDQAVVRFGVETEAETASAALDENSARMSDVISATLEAGVARENIQTAGLQLQPVYNRPDEAPPELTGYRASNVLSVTIEDLDSLGILLDTATDAGVNTIQGIQFEVSEQADLQAQARQAAMNQAIAKAEQLAGLAGAELGEVLTISETGGATPRPVALEAATGAADRVPVEPGQQTLEASVSVTWRLR